jgi:UDP-galactopyranose mutase
MKILIVGAGLSGAVIAREAAELGHSIHVIDRRDHIAGNAADFVNEHGIRQHRYGPHLFHTNNKKVWDYLSKYTEWIPYKHRVRAQLDDGTTVVLPVNREGAERVGKDNIIDIFYRPYTRKMWAKDLEEIDPTVISRVKIRDDDNEYSLCGDCSLMVQDLENPKDYCQVDAKEFSEFEHSVWQFLINQERQV